MGAQPRLRDESDPSLAPACDVPPGLDPLYRSDAWILVRAIAVHAADLYIGMMHRAVRAYTDASADLACEYLPAMRFAMRLHNSPDTDHQMWSFCLSYAFLAIDLACHIFPALHSEDEAVSRAAYEERLNSLLSDADLTSVPLMPLTARTLAGLRAMGRAGRPSEGE